MRSPTFTSVCGSMLLALAISASGLLILARQRHQRLAGRDDVDVLARAGRRRGDRGAVARRVDAARRVLPVASYFGMTSRWPGCSAVPFGILLASAIAEAGTP